jgi:trk system potassium uptake protein TrkH
MGITGDLSLRRKSIIVIIMFIGRLGVLTFGLAIWSKNITSKENAVLEDDIAV